MLIIDEIHDLLTGASAARGLPQYHPLCCDDLKVVLICAAADLARQALVDGSSAPGGGRSGAPQTRQFA